MKLKCQPLKHKCWLSKQSHKERPG